MLDDPLDDTVLSGRIATFQEYQDPVVIVDEVPLQLDELDLQRVQGFLILVLRDRRNWLQRIH